MDDIRLDKSHISYKSTDKIAQICKPLFEEFGINFFRYVRSYKDGTRFNLTSDPEWLDKYFAMRHYLYEFVNFDAWPEPNFSGHSIWTGCKQGHKLCRFWLHFQEQKDYTHNLIIYQKRDNVVELFDFFTGEKNYHLIATHLTNLNVFKHFNYYFKDKARDIINRAEQQKFEVPPLKERVERPDWMIGLLPDDRQQALRKMPIKKYYLTGRFEGVFIRDKELDCLRELAKGKTQEEIGSALNTSRRTVEYRLNSLKTKLFCKNQGELLQLTREEELADILKLNHDKRIYIPGHLASE